MTLFDDFADQPPRSRVDTCCDHLSELDRVDQFVHILGHSRIPFSPAQLSALTDNEIDVVTTAIDHAIERQWIAEVEPEDYMDEPPGLYVGRLVRRR